jgi:hypothetical protein
MLADMPPSPANPHENPLTLMIEAIDWTNKNQGFIMALLTLVYVIATLWLVWVARRQLRQATDLERSRTRPFVIFDLVVEHHFVLATLHNVGQTPASDVRIVVTPNVQCLLGGKGAHPAEERADDISFVSRGVAMLAPQRCIRALVGFWPRVKSAHPELRFEGSVSYRGSDGASYSEPFVADLSVHEGLRYRGTKDIEDVAKQLESMARTFGHLASGFSKPLVRTIAEAEYVAQREALFGEAPQELEQQPTDAQRPSTAAGDTNITPQSTVVKSGGARRGRRKR